MPTHTSQIRKFLQDTAKPCLKTVLIVRKSQKIGSANSNSANWQICGRFQIEQIIQVRKFADLRFAEIICGPPSFASFVWYGTVPM
jgi:hypothetical protein